MALARAFAYIAAMRFLLSLLLTFMLLWGAAFAMYLLRIQAPAASPGVPTDVLVVLTGSSGRVERGFELLADGAAPLLFISGVGSNVTMEEMLSLHATPAVIQKIKARGAKIVLDYQASTTQTNAVESAEFIRARGYHTIRLITGHYHMPRSLVEFHAVLPEVTIYPEPVLSDMFTQVQWWEKSSTRSVIFQEFHKYLAANLRIWMQ